MSITVQTSLEQHVFKLKDGDLDRSVILDPEARLNAGEALLVNLHRLNALTPKWHSLLSLLVGEVVTISGLTANPFDAFVTSDTVLTEDYLTLSCHLLRHDDREVT